MKQRDVEKTAEAVRREADRPAVESSPETDVSTAGQAADVAESQGTGPEEKAAEWAQLQERYLRLAAEFENHKKRTARDWQARVQAANADLLYELLAVVDNFERALLAEHEDSRYARGVALIYDQLKALLTRQGVSAMNAEGEKFDPEIHEALLHVWSVAVPPGHVCQDLRRGYTHHGRVLRPAQVAVSKGPETSDASGSTSPKGEQVNGIESGVQHE